MWLVYWREQCVCVWAVVWDYIKKVMTDKMFCVLRRFFVNNNNKQEVEQKVLRDQLGDKNTRMTSAREACWTRRHVTEVCQPVVVLTNLHCKTIRRTDCLISRYQGRCFVNCKMTCFLLISGVLTQFDSTTNLKLASVSLTND